MGAHFRNDQSLDCNFRAQNFEIDFAVAPEIVDRKNLISMEIIQFAMTHGNKVSFFQKIIT